MIVRLMRVIANAMPPSRRLALEVLVRVAAVVLAAILILGILPAITEAIG